MESAQAPRFKGSILQMCPTSDASPSTGCSGCLHFYLRWLLGQEFPQCPSFRFDNVLEQSTDPFTYYGRFIIKDTNEQPDAEIHRRVSVGSRRVLHTGTSVPVTVGCSTLRAHKCVHQFRLFRSHCLVVLWRSHYIGIIDSTLGHWWLGSVTRTPPLPGDLWQKVKVAQLCLTLCDPMD